VRESEAGARQTGIGLREVARVADSRSIVSRGASDWRLRSKGEREAFSRAFRHSFR